MTPSVVRPCGRLMRKRPDGTLVNDASLEHLPVGLLPLVDAVIRDSIERHGDDLYGVYLRGSAVNGGFLPGVSDLDTWTLVRGGVPDGPRVITDGTLATSRRLEAAYPAVSGVELGHTTLIRLAQPDASFARMLLATQAVCVHGEDILPSLPLVRPGRGTTGHAYHVEASVLELLNDPLDDEEDDVARACTWIGKALVRAGLERHAAEHGQYSRDLFPCYALFAAFHPSEASLMFEAMELSVAPTADREHLRKSLLRFRDVLVPLVRMSRPLP